MVLVTPAIPVILVTVVLSAEIFHRPLLLHATQIVPSLPIETWVMAVTFNPKLLVSKLLNAAVTKLYLLTPVAS